jgi:two-component system, NtrC family, sensor histidine kinase HydH
VDVESQQSASDFSILQRNRMEANPPAEAGFSIQSPGPFKLVWLDVLWLVLLACLALIPPVDEIHKILTLAGIGAFQVLEGVLLQRLNPSRARFYVVVIKILLATLLLGYTGEVPINSSYYLIYYLPIVSAASLYGVWGTVLWTALAAAAYCSYLIPALQEYELTSSGLYELGMRNLFFFLAAIVVNRLITENRRQTRRYQTLAETLSETNRKLAQAQEETQRSERLAALGQLSAGLAHEIRNPLGVIKGSAEMLNKRLHSAEPIAAELAGYIGSEVNRLNGLVSRFLDFARPLKPELSKQEILPVLEQSLQALQLRCPDSQVRVEREYHPDLPPVWIDGPLCEQVMVNLLANAYEAMPTGGLLRITVAPATSDGRKGVMIDMADSGPGIPPEQRKEVFNPFFTTKKSGVGLGLSIVSKIVDNHAGWLRIMDTPGSGACFRIFFPAVEAAAERNTRRDETLLFPLSHPESPTGGSD